MKLLRFVSIALFSLPAIAAARPSHRTAPPTLAEAVADPSSPPPAYLQFDEDFVEGSVARPDGDAVQVRTSTRLRPLHGVRKHFVPELVKATDDL
jgi:hypothetical protein